MLYTIAFIFISQSEFKRPETRERYVGIHANLVHYELDFDFGPIYLSASSPAILSAITLGNIWAVNVGFGPSFKVQNGPRNHWKMDLLIDGTIAAIGQSQFTSLGLVLGFRYEHHKGFSFSVKLPTVGFAFHSPNPVLLYYLVAAISTPVLMVGYRF